MKRVRVWGATAADAGYGPEQPDDGPDEPVQTLRDPVVDNDPCQYCGSYIVPWNMPGECDACLAYQGDDDFRGTMQEWLAVQEAKAKP